MLMKYRLFTPGPTSVPEATLIELAKPVHHHRTGEFRAMFNEVQDLLKYVYQTKNTVYTITGSGTAAAEAGIVSTLAPGKRALCVTNGKFAERWSQVCQAYGIEKKDLKLEYGDAPTAWSESSTRIPSFGRSGSRRSSSRSWARWRRTTGTSRTSSRSAKTR